MELQMFLNGKLVDAVIINASHLRVLHALQQKMEDKHSDMLDLSNEEPQFYIEGISSKMNTPILKEPKKIAWN